MRNVYPEAAEQRCWNHKVLNVLDKLPRKQQAQARLLLCQIPHAQTRAEAERLRSHFVDWCCQRGYGDAVATLERDWDQMVSFYRFPKEHWTHIRTTNPVGSPFAALRLRTDAAKRFKRMENATAVIWKMLLIAESKFRRLNALELMKKVYSGVQYQDGIELTAEEEAAA